MQKNILPMLGEQKGVNICHMSTCLSKVENPLKLHVPKHSLGADTASSPPHA